MNSDFINVKLSAAGEKLAGEAKVVRIHTSRREFKFETGETVRVDKSYEWKHILSKQKHEGEPMFEIVEQPAQEQRSNDGSV